MMRFSSFRNIDAPAKEKTVRFVGPSSSQIRLPYSVRLLWPRGMISFVVCVAIANHSAGAPRCRTGATKSGERTTTEGLFSGAIKSPCSHNNNLRYGGDSSIKPYHVHGGPGMKVGGLKTGRQMLSIREQKCETVEQFELIKEDVTASCDKGI